METPRIGPPGATSDAPALKRNQGSGDNDRYQAGDEVARGGLGRILRATDRRLDREVAIKRLIRADATTRARFAREARITARLQHPAIVPIYDAGEEAGEPFYSMRLVSGRSLDECLLAAAGAAERLALLPNLIAVADAIAYAHDQGVIHRDLKPANVLVGDFGETVVIDWGLAKDLRAADAEHAPRAGPYRDGDAALTVAGSVLGTPSYMPPEQAAGEEVDERADVYALGAMLYQLLAGQRPYRGLSGDRLVAAVIAGPPQPLARLAPEAPPELLSVAQRAMARARADRHLSARELADELRRFQTGQLVRGHRYAASALLLRWLRRHRAAVTVAAAMLAALAVTAAVSVRRIVAERERADAERDLAVARAGALERLTVRRELERDPTAAAARLRRLAARGDADTELVALALDAQARGVARHVLAGGHAGAVRAVEFSPDGSRIASAGDDGVIVEWHLERRASRRVDRHDGALRALVWTGPTPAAAGEGGLVRGGDGVEARHLAEVWAIAATSDGARVFSAGDDGRVLEASERGGRELWRSAGGSAINAIALGHGDLLLAAGDDDGTVRLWPAPFEAGAGADVDTGAGVAALAASPIEARVAVAGFDGALRLIDARAAGAPAVTTLVAAGAGPALSLAFAPDGKTIAVAGPGSSVRLLAMDSGAVRELDGHTAVVTVVRFSPDGRWLVSVAADGARLWQVAAGRSRRLLGHRGAVLAAAFSADGRWLASAGEDGDVRVWSLVEPLRWSPGPPDPWSLRFDAGGGLWVSGFSGEIARLDAGGALVASPLSGRFLDLDASGAVAAVAADGSISWLAPGPGAAPRSLGTLPGGARDLVVSPVGDFVAVAGEDGRVTLHAVDGVVRELGVHAGAVTALAWRSDGKRLASGGSDGVVRVWDVEGGPTRELAGHQGLVSRLRWSDAGALVSAGEDGSVRVWDLERGAAAVQYVTGGLVADVELLADGGIAICGFDGRVRVLRTPGRDGAVEWRHDGKCYDVAVRADGLVASAGRDGSVRLWRDGVGLVGVLRGPDGFVKRVAFAVDGRLAAAQVDGALWVSAGDELDESIDDLADWLAGVTSAELINELPATALVTAAPP